jgi:diguanylate cyclase (GGDEF)-like protein
MHGGIEREEVFKLRKRLERERAARIEAETIAEQGLRDLYVRKEQIKLLHKIAAAANETSDVSEALALALSEICSFTGWAIGHAYVAAAPKHVSLSSNIWYPPSGGFGTFRSTTDTLDFGKGAGLPGRVYETGEPVWIINIAEDINFPRAHAALACGLRAGFAFPVLVGCEVVAVLEFFSMVPQEADPALLDVMAQIGMQLGRVIERRRSEDRLIHDASHDSLTGLPNRALFQDRLAHAAEMYLADVSHKYAVLFIDLDSFKLVNDSLGHLAGDELIIATAHRIRAAVDASTRQHVATLARLGGDEFIILLEHISGPADAARLAEAVQQALVKPHHLHSQTIHSGASIGIACVDHELRDAQDLLRDADIAMYRAKAAGRGRIEVFDESMHLAAVNRLCLENDLRRALANEEFVLYYQPIIALDSTRIVGFEALIRWRRGAELVYPDDFISVAEETGLIIYLGEWVLRQACASVSDWLREVDCDEFTMSVNISPRHFAQPNFVDSVKRIIATAGIAPHHIRLELTETVTINDAERTIRVLAQLRELGVRIAIDDFGTGYSSLSYLQRLPLDVLKIDRSFVLDMDNDPNSRQIVQTIMTLAKSLGMDVVAEGTESASQVLDLVTMGCRFGQGYFFSKPIDALTAKELLNTGLADVRSSAA